MTDAEIRASKWEHLVHRLDLRRLVQEGTPSRTLWSKPLPWHLVKG